MALNILLIDDDPSVRDALAIVIGDAGHTVRCAGDQSSASAMLDEAIPDLVLTDLQIPGMADAGMVELVRARVPHLAIIAMSGSPLATTFDEARRCGADFCLSKPFDWTALEQAVSAALVRAG